MDPRSVCEYTLAGVLGGGAVGKTSLVCRFVKGSFPGTSWDPSDEGFRKIFKVDDQTTVLTILDPGHGQHGDPRTLPDFYIRNCEGFLLVYSITSRKSFEEISTVHRKILRLKGKGDYPVFVCAAKCDLKEMREVGIEEGRAFAKQIGCRFFDTSAKTWLNVEEVFHDLVREIRKVKRPEDEETDFPPFDTINSQGGIGLSKTSGEGSCGSCVVA